MRQLLFQETLNRSQNKTKMEQNGKMILKNKIDIYGRIRALAVILAAFCLISLCPAQAATLVLKNRINPDPNDRTVIFVRGISNNGEAMDPLWSDLVTGDEIFCGGSSEQGTTAIGGITFHRSFNYYSFDYFVGLNTLKTLGGQLLNEIKRLDAEGKINTSNGYTIIGYSFGALVVRAAVLLATDPEAPIFNIRGEPIFQYAHVVQVAPMIGGSNAALLQNYVTFIGLNAIMDPDGLTQSWLYGSGTGDRFMPSILRSDIIQAQGDKTAPCYDYSNELRSPGVFRYQWIENYRRGYEDYDGIPTVVEGLDQNGEKAHNKIIFSPEVIKQAFGGLACSSWIDNWPTDDVDYEIDICLPKGLDMSQAYAIILEKIEEACISGIGGLYLHNESALNLKNICVLFMPEGSDRGVSVQVGDIDAGQNKQFSLPTLQLNPAPLRDDINKKISSGAWDPYEWHYLVKNCGLLITAGGYRDYLVFNIAFHTCEEGDGSDIEPTAGPIRIKQVRILDSISRPYHGNGNGRLDAGERAGLEVVLENTGKGEARYLNAYSLEAYKEIRDRQSGKLIEVNDEFVPVQKKQSYYGNIGPGFTAEPVTINDGTDEFVLNVSDKVTFFYKAKLRFKLSGQNYNDNYGRWFDMLVPITGMRRHFRIPWLLSGGQVQSPSSYPRGPQLYSQACLADINNDGVREILAPDGERELLALDPRSGTTIDWNNLNSPRRNNDDGYARVYPAAADIDNDGSLELVVSNSVQNTLEVFKNGSPSWFIDGEAQGIKCGIPAVADLDNKGDGRLEIVMAKGGVVSIIASTGQILQVMTEDSTNYPGFSSAVSANKDIVPLVTDYNNDGQAEIIITCLILERKSSTPGGPLSDTFSVASLPGAGKGCGAVAVDIDQDKNLEIFSGAALWSNRGYSTTDEGNIESIGLPVSADINNDGNPEFLAVYQKNDGRAVLKAFCGMPAVLWEFNFPEPVNNGTPLPLAIYDWDQDNNLEIVAVVGPGQENNAYGKIYILDSQGELLSAYEPESIVGSAPIIAPPYTGAVPEVLIGNFADSQNSVNPFVMESFTVAPGGSKKVYWPQLQRDNNRSGYYNTAAPANFKVVGQDKSTLVNSAAIDEGAKLTLYAQSDGSRANTLFYAVRSIPEGATCIKKSDTEAEFVWQPNYRQAGTYNLNFIVSDGVQEVSKNIAVTVRDKNGPPEFLPLDSRLSVNEGDLIEFDVKAVDPDNDTVYCDISSPLTLPNRANFDENTGRFSWRPDYFQSGEYTFEFMATDNRNGSVYKTITINVINKPAPPQFDLSTPENVQGYETQRISFVVRAWDPERPDLPVTYQVELLSAKQPESRYRFIASIGRFIWYPGKQDSGDYVFSFTARNQAGDVSEPLIINIHVDDLNVAPVLSPIGDKQVYTGQTLSFKLAATDADSDPITYSSTNLPQGAVLNATTGDFSWTPTQRQAGTYNISFSASDGQAADSKNTTITVLALGNLKVEVIGWRSPRRGSSLGYTDVTVISADKSISRKATTSYYGDPVSFLNLPAGPYTVTASKTGWKTKSRDITISANQTLQLRIDLEYKTPGN